MPRSHFVIALLLLLAALPLANPALASETSRTSKCDRVKKKIQRIESRMRAGYTAKQSVRLADRLRELRRERSKVCRW